MCGQYGYKVLVLQSAEGSPRAALHQGTPHHCALRSLYGSVNRLCSLEC